VRFQPAEGGEFSTGADKGCQFGDGGGETPPRSSWRGTLTAFARFIIFRSFVGDDAAARRMSRSAPWF
jgi:hypothetical protein